MNVYLNYAKEHWTQPGENPPVGLILTLEKDEALARYALEGLQNSVLARGSLVGAVICSGTRIPSLGTRTSSEMSGLRPLDSGEPRKRMEGCQGGINGAPGLNWP